MNILLHWTRAGTDHLEFISGRVGAQPCFGKQLISFSYVFLQAANKLRQSLGGLYKLPIL